MGGKVEEKVFTSLNRRLMMKEYLERNGKQSLEEMKQGFRKESKVMPFIDSEDKEILEWLDTIEGVSRTVSNGVPKYSIVEALNKLHHDIRVTSTAKKINVSQNNPEINPIRPLKTRPNQGWRFSNTQDKENCRTGTKSGVANLYNIPLLGDDQFLNIAMFDLDFERYAHERRRQSGYCVSGLRISEATERLVGFNSNVNQIIVNVGSVDVAENRPLIVMIKDMNDFLSVCKKKNIQPILTTLAPMVNSSERQKIVLRGFNRFIFNLQYSVIDLYNCMMTFDDQINKNLYQARARHVSGSKKTFFLWNKIGRERVTSMLVKHLGEAIIFDKYVGEKL